MDSYLRQRFHFEHSTPIKILDHDSGTYSPGRRLYDLLVSSVCVSRLLVNFPCFLCCVSEGFLCPGKTYFVRNGMVKFTSFYG